MAERGSDAARVLARRLDWRSRGEAVGVMEDRVTMARTFTYLFGLGGTLLLLTLAFAPASDRHAGALVATALCGYAVAAWFLVGFERIPLWAFRTAPALGTILVSLAVYFGGSSVAAAYAMFYFWVALATCYFMPVRLVAAHLAFASLAFGVTLLALSDVPSAGVKWAMATGTLLVTGVVLTALRSQVGRLVEALGSAARTDPLTGLANRRELENRFAAELERSTRGGRPLSILVLDLDWFKEFNDRFGHTAGDRALAQLGEALRRGTRTSDVVARLGGEEFAVLAPETDEQEGLLLAERLRAEVRLSFARQPEQMTLSCGLASFPVHGITAGELLHAADRALYEAKEGGRDRSVVYRETTPMRDGGERLEVEQTSPRLASLLSLAEAVDRRKGSPANSRRVAEYASRLARALNLPEEEVERIRIAALLRDVGEVGVAESILSKAGPLTEEERRELERHPDIGARIVGAAQLGRVGEWILSHHERPDGAGYPRGLRRRQIPLEGRILAVADAYAAMTAERPYRRRYPPKRARAELQARAGSQFDHDVVEAFLSLNGEREADADRGPASRSA